MTNTDVLKCFLQGQKAQTPKRQIQNGYYMYEGRTLTTDGITLINYKTRIAYKEGNNLMINNKKYSVTTSKIQNQLLRLALETYRNGNIIFYEEEV